MAITSKSNKNLIRIYTKRSRAMPKNDKKKSTNRALTQGAKALGNFMDRRRARAVERAGKRAGKSLVSKSLKNKLKKEAAEAMPKKKKKKKKNNKL